MQRLLGLLGVFCLIGCGGGGGSTSTQQQTSTPTESVTSISITPTSANVPSGQTTQFTAKVSGTGDFSQAVTWSVAGDGTIDSNGVFTAGTTSGTATVQVASTEDPTVINSASVNVTQSVADLGDWSGKMTTTDGSQSVPLDFHLFAQGNTLSATNSQASENLGVLAIWLNETTAQPNCINFTLPQTPTFNQVSGDIVPYANIQINGTQTGTGMTPGSVNLTWSASNEVSIPFGTSETISLSGQFSTDGNTLSGTYSNTGYLASCFPSSTSGTFTFSKYETQNSNTYQGTFAFGTGGQVPISLSFGTYPMLTIGALPGVCGSATSVKLIDPGQEDGRFFFFHSDNFTQSSIGLWGVVNDQTANSITIYTTLTDGQLSVNSPCIQEVSSTGNNLLNGLTLTKQ